MADVLVVDDVATNARLLSGFLRPMTVRTAASGPQALEMIQAELPDLILLDAMMPGMNGFELLEILKKDGRTQHIPVIMVTALSAIEDKIRGQEAGADDFITKPFDRTELILRVKSMLRIKSLHDQLTIKVEELELARKRLRELAETDELTGIYNKRYLTAALGREWERAHRYDREFSIILIDIDFFKRYNDQYGHPTGDHVLRQCSQILQDQARRVDTLGRYGGEEFLHLLLETGPDGAAVVAERHRQRFEVHSLVDEHDRPIGNITISAGISSYPQDGSSLEELVKRSDERLYVAKRNGRNQVVGADATPRVVVPARS